MDLASIAPYGDNNNKNINVNINSILCWIPVLPSSLQMKDILIWFL